MHPDADVPPDPNPLLASIDAFALMRQASAALDPRIQELQQRAAAGGTWCDAVLSKDEPAARLLREAIDTGQSVAAGGKPPTDPSDARLLQEAWMLLASHGPDELAEMAERVLARLEAPVAATSEQPATAMPQRIGNYDLIELIGVGSSGSVFRARHHDNGSFGAVKLLRMDAWNPELVTRFRDEARIVARLDHPAIVRVLHSGVEELGGVAVPFLVTELIEGRPFAAAMAGREPREVLRAFITVCDAVAHAHERQVLHRDLKSSNVLVDAAHAPHLLDFGIARFTGADAVRHTRSDLVVGTPAVMSPEQATATPVDPCSEVWSLGALMFEALTGHLPHDLEGLAGLAALRKVAEHEPRRVRSLRPDLDLDLAALTDKALAFDRANRYPTVRELQNDVQRWLAGEPVAARPETAWQALRRLARRHRVFATAAASVALAILLGTVTAVWFWRDAVRAQAGALEAMESALAFAGHLVETSSPTKEQRRLLDEALARVVRQRSAAPDELALLRAEARLREHLGDATHRQQDLAASRQYRERVRELEAEALARQGGDTGDLARALVKLGDLEKLEDIDAGWALYLEAHELFLARASTDAADDTLDDLGWSYERLADASLQRGDSAKAVALIEERVAIARRLLGKREGGLQRYGLANALAVAAVTFRAAAVPDAARRVRELMEEACDHAARAVAAEPTRRAFLQSAGALVLGLVTDLAYAREGKRAIELLDQALPWAEALVQGDPASSAHRGMLSDMYVRLACCCDQTGDLHRAQQARAASVAVLRPDEARK